MKNTKEQDKKEKDESRELLEQASNQLASIVIAWIELSRSKNKNENDYERK